MTQNIGLAPGTLIYQGDKPELKSVVDIISYNQKVFNDAYVIDDLTVELKLNPNEISWVNYIGLNDVDTLQEFCKSFNIHALSQEDIIDTELRPKIEVFENYIFITLKMIFLVNNEITYEHISFVVGDSFLISFQELREDVFNSLRDRIKNPKSRLRKKNTTYLLYALLDSIVDNYYVVLDSLNEEIAKLEESIFLQINLKEVFIDIHENKQEIIKFKKQVAALREIINSLLKLETDFIDETTNHYIKDLHSNIVEVLDGIDSSKESIHSLTELYMHFVSNKTNETMKVLTIVASVFIPLTFIAGIYGMNFKNIPELNWDYGYAYSLGLMTCIAILMLFILKRKDWL